MADYQLNNTGQEIQERLDQVPVNEQAISELETSVSGKADVATTLAGYGITDAYTKEQVDSMITTPDQNYVTVPTYEELPATGQANTIYRVANWDGTQVTTSAYSEYAWNGSEYRLLSVKQVGIDDVPTAGSDNLVKSSGLYDILHDQTVVSKSDMLSANYNSAVTNTRGFYVFTIVGSGVNFTFKRVADSGINYAISVRTSTSYNAGTEIYNSNWISDTDVHTYENDSLAQQCYLHVACMYAEGEGYPTFAEFIAGIDTFEATINVGSSLYQRLGTVEDETGLLTEKLITNTISFDAQSFSSGERWINDDGSIDLVTPNNAGRLVIPVVSNYDNISVTLGCTAAVKLAIAFYSTKVIGSASFISGVKTKNNASYTLDVAIPSNAQLIVVTNRPASNANPSATITGNIVVTDVHASEITQLGDAVDSAVQSVDNIEKSIYTTPASFSSHVESGTITMTVNGWTYEESNSRYRTAESYTIHLPAGVTIKTTNRLRFATSWRKENDTYGLSYWQSEWTTIEAGDYVFIFEKTGGDLDADFVSSNFYCFSNDTISESLMNIQTAINSFDFPDGDTEYYGDRVVLADITKKKNKCNKTIVHTVNWVASETPTSIDSNHLVDTQSSTIINGYMFVFLDLGGCVVIDFDTKAIVDYYTIPELSTYHCNNVQASNIYYEENDTYPLVLVSNGGEQAVGSNAACMYIRITENNGTFSFTCIKEIQSTYEYGYHTGTFCADWLSGKLYLTCMEKIYSTQGPNNIIFVVYDLPPIGDGSAVVLQDSDITQKKFIPVSYGLNQGCTLYEGTICLGGQTREINGLAYPSGYRMLMFIDSDSLCIKSVLSTFGKEIEGVSVYDNKLYITERVGGWSNRTDGELIFRIVEFDFD